MSSRNTQPYYFLIAPPVILVIVAAFALSVAAAMENLHFLRATSQIFDLVGTTRSIASAQKNIAFIPGEDIWDDLVRAGQIPSDTPRANDWGGPIKMAALANEVMRIESDMPTHDCRRMALYFLDRQPADLGLIAIEAQSAGDKAWTLLYPQPAVSKEDDLILKACGKNKGARLALVFRIK